MSFFYNTPVKSLEKVTDTDFKSITGPPVLTQAEIRKYSSTLAYALPALITAAKAAKGGGKGKSKGDTGENRKFPSPARISMLNKPYTFVQTLPIQSFNSSNALPTFTTTFVTLSVLDQVSSFTSIFDQYRIALLEVRYLPRLNVNDVQGTTLGTFVSVVDLDDANTLTTVPQALDYSGAQVSEGFKEHKHTFVPHCAVAAYSGAFTSFINVAAPWVDCGSTAVQHYGTKTAWSTTTAAYSYDLVVRVMVEFRNVR
jgi:hypothetical protein